MRCCELVTYLDEYLDIRRVPDYPSAHNGLQVEGDRDVRRLAVAVDACRFTIEAAVAMDADMLLVHHGLAWTSTMPLVGAAYRRLAPVIRAGMSVYSAHLPLDLHPEVGNNHVLARMLGLQVTGMWDEYEGVPIGVRAAGDGCAADFECAVARALSAPVRLIGDPNAPVRSIGIVTGGAASSVVEAARLGLDLMITGEARHSEYFAAEESGVNVILAGHYATETVGIMALADHLSARFGLTSHLIAHPTGL
jgi:dinuclear metal center YbgI/SA1388 family protein